MPLITDFRGTEWAEYLLFTHMNVPVIREIVDAIETRELLLVEKQVYEESDAVSCVSPQFQLYLALMWGQRSSVRVNPCLAQSGSFHFDAATRLAHRERHMLSAQDIVILFSTGGASPWQNITPIIKSFRQLRQRQPGLRQRLKLVILTAATADNATNEDAVTISSSTPGDMNKWLNLADIGVLIRDENIVNYVASPIKVSEYVCAGLPIVCNRGVPMAVEWVQTTGAGAVVSDLSALSESDLLRLGEIDRESLSAAGIAEYGLDNIAQSYRQMYAELLQTGEAAK
jgi:hypothetical protein